MGEAVKVLLNALGLTTVIFAFIANLDNFIAWALGAAAFTLGVVKILHARESWLIRRLHRKQKERDFKANRTLEEEEKDEYG